MESTLVIALRVSRLDRSFVQGTAIGVGLGLLLEKSSHLVCRHRLHKEDLVMIAVRLNVRMVYVDTVSKRKKNGGRFRQYFSVNTHRFIT